MKRLRAAIALPFAIVGYLLAGCAVALGFLAECFVDLAEMIGGRGR